MTPFEFFMHFLNVILLFKARPVTKGLFLTHTLHAYHLIHPPRCSIKQKQSAAIMNSLYCKCRGKGSDVKQDRAALMLSVNFIEQRQTTLNCASSPQESEGGSAPPRTNTHFTFLISSTRRREREEENAILIPPCIMS